MKRLFIVGLALLLGAVATIESAEAARLGGGRSFGAQRITPMQRRVQPATPPQQSSAKPAQPAPAAPAAAPGSRWLGPIAGLAAGLGLGWLIGHGGLGGMFGSLLLMLVLAFAVVSLIRLFVRRNEESSQQAHFAGIAAEIGNETVAAPPPSQIPTAEGGSPPDFRSQFQARIPPGFDADGFVKQAKLNFVRLQEANDRGNVDALREMTTEEMFAELKLDLAQGSGPKEQTEVLSLSASLLEVVTEGPLHWASVRFVGSLREASNAAPLDFEEIWNLRKPVDGKTGWLLAGIQQPALT